MEATFVEVGDADGHRAILGGLTTLERVIRGLGKQGVTRVIVPSAPFDVETEGVVRARHDVTVEWVAPGTKPAPGQPVVRGDELLGIRIVDDKTRRKAEWALFNSLPKTHQGPTDGWVNQHISLRITRQLCKTPIRPNDITILSLFWGIAACAIVLEGSWTAMAIAGVMMQAHNILDSCDGELARLRFQYTSIGAWLDNVFDEIVDDAFIACAGIAAGGVWAYIGIFGGSARFLAVALQWREMVRLSLGGNSFAFRYWFEGAETSADEIYGKRAPSYYIRAIGRRDTYVLGFMVLLLCHAPEGIAIWGAVPGAINISLMTLHLILKPRS